MCLELHRVTPPALIDKPSRIGSRTVPVHPGGGANRMRGKIDLQHDHTHAHALPVLLHKMQACKTIAFIISSKVHVVHSTRLIRSYTHTPSAFYSLLCSYGVDNKAPDGVACVVYIRQHYRILVAWVCVAMNGGNNGLWYIEMCERLAWVNTVQIMNTALVKIYDWIQLVCLIINNM